MIAHEYGSKTGRGPCKRMVLVTRDEARILVADEKGESVWVTDDRSIYEYCGQPKSKHASEPDRTPVQ